MSDPRGFLKYPRQEISRRPVPDRLKDWDEVYVPAVEENLRKQGARCMDCGVPFCQSSFGCPVENLIPDWNSLVQQGRWREALESLHSTNNFPEFTGRLCPAPCESACVLGISDSPVTIRSIESSIVDRGFSEGWITAEPATRTSGKTVAVVGSGPAGLAAAQQLARLGHQVTVFEKSDRAGGLLRYGIPDFKMQKSILDRRLSQLAAEGVEFRCGVQVGVDIAIEKLRADFDAVCLTLGAEKPRELPIPGRDLGGVALAMDYLTHSNRVQAGLEKQRPELDARGKRVIILGGGDTGSDCLGTSHRQECATVLQLELMAAPPEKSATAWPLWPMKFRSSHAHEEGGERVFSVLTTHFSGTAGKVEKLHAREQGAGRESAAEFSWDADLVILALGFSGVELPASFMEQGINSGERGVLFGDDRFATGQPGVFVAGDARRGASLIVWCIAEGRKMATSVDTFLRGSS